MNQPSNAVIKKVQKLYQSNQTAQRFFDGLALRLRDATATNVDLMARSLGISRGDAVSLGRAIHDTGAAELFLGRRGGKTRLVWEYSCISIGKAASGESSDLEAPENPMTDDEEEATESALQAVGSGVANPRFSIKDAKRMLSEALGVDESSIEIVIKA